MSCYDEAHECDHNHTALQDGGKIHQTLEDVSRLIQSGLEEIKRQRTATARETPAVPEGVAPVTAHPSGSVQVQPGLMIRDLECVECGKSAFADGLRKPRCQRSVICPICNEWVHSCGTEQKMQRKWKGSDSEWVDCEMRHMEMHATEGLVEGLFCRAEAAEAERILLTGANLELSLIHI